MSDLRDIVVFSSVRFSPVLPEDAQVNPQVYGAELAYWLCTELARRGVDTSYPEHEDWGWYLGHTTPAGSEFAVHCGNVTGSRERWLLSLKRYGRKLFGRDKPPYSEAGPLIDAIKRALDDEPSVRSVHWVWDEQAA